MVLFVGLALVASLLGAVSDFVQRAQPAMTVMTKMSAWFHGDLALPVSNAGNDRQAMVGWCRLTVSKPVLKAPMI